MPESFSRPDSDGSVPAESPEHRAAESLPSAMLLAFTGGSLDAFVYLNHGHAFAAAMTGNGVLLGVSILSRNGHDVLQHLLPVLAFFAGVWGAKLLEGHLKRHAVTLGLLCEIMTLFIASWLPHSFPDIIFVPVIALAAAYQVASFRTVDNYSYNSTFITSNLRTAVEGLYESLDPIKRSDGLRKFREFSLIIASFLAGAITGAVLASRFGNHTLWFIDVPLFAVLLVVLQRDRETRTES